MFCKILCYSAVPTTVDILIRYVVYLASQVNKSGKRLKYATIDNYVSAVISLNKFLGHDVSGCRESVTFKLTMSGIKRWLGDPTPDRPTLLISQLLKMYTKVDLSNINQRTLWTCITVCFRGLLRKSNVVPDSVSNPTCHYLRRSAVKFFEWGMVLIISSSKTIQYGQRTHTVPITKALGSPLCATTWVNRHFNEVPITDPESPAFMLVSGDRKFPVTYPVLLKFLKSLLDKCGFNSAHTGLHSLRRSGALFMHDSGLGLDDIRQHGDWNSMAALVYLTKPLQLRIVNDSIVSKALLL